MSKKQTVGEAKELTPKILKDLERVAKKIGRVPMVHEYLEHGRFQEWQVRKTFGGFSKAVKAAGMAPLENAEYLLTKQITKLKAEKGSLEEMLSEAQRDAINADKLRELVGSIQPEELGAGPAWLARPKNPHGTTGIPVLFLSDLHFDEVVHPEQIEFVNEYNRDIATKRIKHTFQTAVDLLKNVMATPTYDGMVVVLGGDLLSGNIHEELAESNAARINESIFALTDLLIDGLTLMASEFGKVFVPCVTGNHGRMHKKPRAKFRAVDNYEWLIYQYLQRHFKNDKRLTFMIPEGPDATFRIYGKTFCLTHGDQFRGGGGIAGALSPLMLGKHRKSQRNAQAKKPFDYLMMGHWHQYIHLESGLIVNGSTKGYDEYAAANNFPLERPMQAMFIVHPAYGITIRMPVICDSYDNSKYEAPSPGASKLQLVW